MSKSAKVVLATMDDDHDHRTAPPPEVWYYADGAGRKGPFILQELREILANRSDVEDVLIWGTQRSSWSKAKEILKFGGQAASPTHPANQIRGGVESKTATKAADSKGHGDSTKQTAPPDLWYYSVGSIPGYSIYQRAHKPQGIEIAGEFLAPCMPR